MKKILLILLTLVSPAMAQTYQGFGSSTIGGLGGTVVHVTNNQDSGTGSFRAAVTGGGNRYILFDVSGTIPLLSDVSFAGDNVTIDGSSAPGPGVIISGATLVSLGRHDFIITGLRFRNCASGAQGDCITIKNNGATQSFNFVISNVSTSNPDSQGSNTDGNIDITSSHDGTVQYSIMSNNLKSMLINYGAYNLSIHHNLFTHSQWRNPNVQWMDADIPNTTPPTNITADVRNNLVYAWGIGGGTILQCLGKANVINNYYENGQAQQNFGPIVPDGGSCPNLPGPYGASYWIAGNVSAESATFPTSNVGSPFSAATVTTTPACQGGIDVLHNAGARPLDAFDQALINEVPLPGCPCH